MSDFSFLFVGHSGSGKTTIVEELSRRFGYSVVQSLTDRPMRFPGETGHTFVSTEEYLAIPNKVAETFFDGHYYGVPAEMIEENDLYVIDPCGVHTMKELYHGSKTPVVIVIWVPEEIRVQRMLARGDSEESIAKRLANDAEKFPIDDLKQMADFWVVNDDLEKAIQEIHGIILSKTMPQ